MKNEYLTICDKCYKRTWYDTEQQCHYKYEDFKTCDLGHKHGTGEMKRCEGTLRVIDNTNAKTYLTIGERYSFRDKNGLVKKFTLGKTTGWKPCLLLLHNSRSTGSSLCVNAGDLNYKDGAYNTNIYFI